jgi:hypothetical protein
MDPDTERITRPVLEYRLLIMLSLLNSSGSTVAKPHLNNLSFNASALPDRELHATTAGSRPPDSKATIMNAATVELRFSGVDRLRLTQEYEIPNSLVGLTWCFRQPMYKLPIHQNMISALGPFLPALGRYPRCVFHDLQQRAEKLQWRMRYSVSCYATESKKILRITRESS